MDNRKLWVLGGAALFLAIGSAGAAQASPVMGKIDRRAGASEFTPVFPQWGGGFIGHEISAQLDSRARQTARSTARRTSVPGDTRPVRQSRHRAPLLELSNDYDSRRAPNLGAERRSERSSWRARQARRGPARSHPNMRPTHGGAPPWRPQREPHGSPADYRNRHRDDGPWARRHDSYRFDAPSFGQRTFQWRPEATDSHGHTPRPPGHQISGNGKLLFSNFHIHGIDRDDITLESLEDGLRISGPVGLHARGLEFFTVSYKVTALDETMPILGASLELDSITEPGHPLAMVFAGTTLFGKGNAFFPEWKRLETYDIGGHIEHPSDHTDFRKPREHVYVKDRVYLRSGGPHAEWISSTNHFPVLVPEPGTASLLALGLTGLVIAGRRRR